MRKRIFLAVFSVVIVILISGCMNIRQELWVNSDGSGKMKIDIGVDEDFMSMEDLEGMSGGDLTSMESEYENDPNIKNIQTSEYTEDGLSYTSIQFDIIDFDAFVHSSENEMDMTYEQLGNGNYLLAMNLDSLAGGGDETYSSEDLEMFSDMFDDYYFEVTMHVPQVVETSGKKTDSGTAYWQIPLMDALNGEISEISVEYSMEEGQGIVEGIGDIGEIEDIVGDVIADSFLDNLFPKKSTLPIVLICGLCLCGVILVAVVLIVVLVVRKRKAA
ncbi:MAG: hypothetical protein JEZ06_07480 [Anaerolineaceae bacterium]|nr:hypothetical protein [Anaerolineaceae bacterium]